MTDPVKVPVNVQETQVPRFKPRFVALFAFLAVAVVVVMFWVLAAATNVFDSTVTYAGADGKQVVESTFDMATAKFAIAALLAVGAFTVLAGVVVELADMKVVTTRSADATAEVTVAADGVVPESIAASGAAAVGVALQVVGFGVERPPPLRCTAPDRYRDDDHRGTRGVEHDPRHRSFTHDRGDVERRRPARTDGGI